MALDESTNHRVGNLLGSHRKRHDSRSPRRPQGDPDGGPARREDRAGTKRQSIADGLLTIEPVLDSEWSHITELINQYADLPLGMVDASVVALAKRHRVTEIATLDRRHFSVVRPRHVYSFTLLS